MQRTAVLSQPPGFLYSMGWQPVLIRKFAGVSKLLKVAENLLKV